MTGRLLAPGLYGLGDLAVGDRIETGEAVVSADEIDRFAALTGDRFAIHMSDDAARELGFARRVAHGLLVLSLIDGLKNQAPAQVRAVASLHWDWSFRAPVLMDDAIRANFAVRAMRPTGNGRRGILMLDVEVRNQHGEIVQAGTNLLMVTA
jgi:3-hydroxybutyryl-CoA dehydratase